MSAISTWSSTAANNNSAAPNGAPEGMAPSGVNNVIRENMAQVRTWYEEPEWIDDGRTYTRSDGDTVTVAGVDVTATWHANRRVRIVGGNTGTIYGRVESSSFSTNTTINFVFDSGSIDSGDSTVTASYGILSADTSAIPTTSPVISLGTEAATTSGTEHDFTIPTGIKRIAVMFSGVSTSGTSNLLIQLGDSGGVETTGYVSSAVLLDGSPNSVNSTAGLLLTQGHAAANALHGTVVLTLEDAAGFTWTAAGTLAISGDSLHTSGGSKSTSAELTTVRVTTVNGSDTFDAGAINVQYQA